ncbi:MAG: TMEM175 family protein [Actinomycetota bacterium]|nr:TMEM175 family protein [Actinomycetota bacterium]
MEPSRLNALIDGVFAIAVTLLVLDLPRPASSTHLTHELLHRWPSYGAYLVSFATIGIVWIEHHGMMSAVRYINRRFLERTLLVLLLISIIPWPTALAAEYGTHGGPAARTVAVLYATIMMLMGLSIALSWRYLNAHPGTRRRTRP